MGHPRLSVICEGEEISPGDNAVVNDVLAGLEMPPEVAIVERPRCKKKGVGKYVYLKNFYKRPVHGERLRANEVSKG